MQYRLILPSRTVYFQGCLFSSSAFSFFRPPILSLSQPSALPTSSFFFFFFFFLTPVSSLFFPFPSSFSSSLTFLPFPVFVLIFFFFSLVFSSSPSFYSLLLILLLFLPFHILKKDVLVLLISPFSSSHLSSFSHFSLFISFSRPAPSFSSCLLCRLVLILFLLSY